MKVILSLGSNIGDRTNYLQRARKLIDLKCGIIENESAIYETASWGSKKQPSFLNQIIVIRCELGPFSLFNRLCKIERMLGRKQKGNLKPRTIDIDILYYDQLVIETRNLILPHPRLHLRKFNLLPLADIEPDFHHPILNKTSKKLLQDCADDLAVVKYKTA